MAAIWITVILGVITAVTGGLAGHLAAQKEWHKWAFWGAALLTVGLLFVQGVFTQKDIRDAEERGKQEQSQLNRIEKNTGQPPNVIVNPPAVHIPSAPRHTQVMYAANFGAPPNDPLLPLHEGQDLALNVGWLNNGEFPADSPMLGSMVVVLPFANSLDGIWRQFSPQIKKNIMGGTLLVNRNGQTNIQYRTFSPDHPLTKDELSGLTSSPPQKMLCVLGKVDWRDETGSYETSCMECMVREPDGTYNVHQGSQHNAEHRVGR